MFIIYFDCTCTLINSLLMIKLKYSNEISVWTCGQTVAVLKYFTHIIKIKSFIVVIVRLRQ